MIVRSVVAVSALLTLWGASPTAAVPQADLQEGQADTLARLVFLDVGQGDALLVRAPEGRTALVDAGPKNAGIVAALRRHGVEAIDLAVATHPHADHIGGMAAVLSAFPVRYYLDNGVPHTTSTYQELLRALMESDVTYLEATPRTLRLGTVRLEVLPPPADAEDHNGRSVGLLLRFGAFEALLTGDAPVDELNHFFSLGVPDVELLKASHHGSRDGVSPRWLDVTRPELVVISCGRDNPYGHPHAAALRYYEAAASAVYRTDRHGEVTVLAARDGSYRVTTTDRH